MGRVSFQRRYQPAIRSRAADQPAVMPFGLTDRQLELVMRAASSVPPEKRDTFLQRIAARLQAVGLRHPTDDDVASALRKAVEGLVHAPAA